MKRFNVWVCHRRFGKTVAAVNEAIKQNLEEPLPDARTHYIGPTYSQTKRIAWKYCKQYSAAIPGVEFNESELLVRFPHGGELQLLGAEKYDSHRGIYSDFAVFDEPALHPPGVFDEVFRPALADREGGAIWIGTPAGRQNQFFHRYCDAQKFDEWQAQLWKITDTGAIALKELQSMRREMTDMAWRAEMMCDFSAGVRGAYYQAELDYLERNDRICAVPWDSELPVITSWDLGLDDQTVIHYWQQGGREHRLIDVDIFRNVGLADIIKQVKAKPYLYSRHWAPHDIHVRDYTSATSRFDFAANLGIDFEPNTANLSVEDGIQAVRSGLRKTVIDNSKCLVSIESLRIYRAEYDDRKGVYRNKPFHGPESDIADSVRYYFVNESTPNQGSLFGGPIDYSEENRTVI